jgi:prolipoprotein diacylglyceryltransferase
VRLAAIAFPAIDPIAFRVGPFAVRWYGIAYLLGFLGAYLVMRWLIGRWRLNISDDDQLTIVLAAVVGVVLGGRLGYVFFYGDGYYWSHPAQILALWDGGMSFHGGLIGILVAAAVIALTMRIPWLTLCDLGSVGAPIGLFFGRIANFVNQELWGRVTTVPWGAARGGGRLCRDARARGETRPAAPRRSVRRAALALRRIPDFGGVSARARFADRSSPLGDDHGSGPERATYPGRRSHRCLVALARSSPAGPALSHEPAKR